MNFLSHSSIWLGVDTAVSLLSSGICIEPQALVYQKKGKLYHTTSSRAGVDFLV